MKPNTSASQHPPGRKLQVMTDKRHDAYEALGKSTEPAACPDCGLVRIHGRWQYGTGPAGATEERCPACRRIHDEFPAGVLTIEGPFAYEHRAQVLATAKHVETRERAEHPLERIMAIDEQPERVVVTTTGVHLAQAIGRALKHAFRGRLRYEFADSEYFVRVDWAA